MYSVICPTMWRGIELEIMLPLIQKHPLVGEILIIDNDHNSHPLWLKNINSYKLKRYDPGMNIYVNPAFNIGISKSKYDKICLLSDDIVFDPMIFDYLHDTITENRGCVGCDVKNMKLVSSDDLNKIPAIPKNIKVELCDWPLHPGYAVLMFLHKNNFIPISSEFRIHMGEAWIYQTHLLKHKLPLKLQHFSLNCSKVMSTSGLPEFKMIAEVERGKLRLLPDMVAKCIVS